MKMFVVSDNKDTCTGFRLAGVSGVAVQERAAAVAALRAAAADPEIGILLVTQKLAALCPEEVEALRGRAAPLVAEIPDRQGGGAYHALSRYIEEAIGLKI